MITTRAVVLAAGRGTRMRQPAAAVLSAEQDQMAERGLKAMMSVGRPFLDYLLTSLADAGLREICLVIGPDHSAIPDRYRHQIPVRRLDLEFAIQDPPLGTAHALLAAEPFVATGPFVLVNGDNLYPVDALHALAGFDTGQGAPLAGPGLIGYRRDELIAESNIDAERISRFALVWADAAGNLTDILEKPEPSRVADPAALVSMNSWRFDGHIFAACRAIPRSPRGEYELQDAVRHELRRGIRYQVVPWAGGVLDLTHRSDVPAVTERLRSLEVSL